MPMLLIPNYLAKSSIEGYGVFTAVDIPEGKITWCFNPLIDVMIRGDEISDLPVHVKGFLKTYAVCDKDGNYHTGIDNDRFINHSLDPNIMQGTIANICFAIKDIPANTEMTQNYIIDFPYDREVDSF